MSKSQVIAILFDGNSENIFHVGQLVTGNVHVQTSERIKIRGIRLEITAKAETSWTEGTGDDKTSYSGEEVYMNLEINLIGSRSHDSVMYLEPSVCNYPFSFILPPELPQSFDDITGHIRYRAKAVIDRPMKIDDKAEVLFTVIRLLDLNREPPHLREPQVIHSEAPASGCCCVAGIAEINATINRGCFVPGETIFIDGEIVNRTNSTVKYSTICLMQKIEYRATFGGAKVYHTTYALQVLAKFERPFIRRRATDSWKNISLVVPRVKSSRLDGCTIIDIKHYIEISVIFHACCSRTTASSEIVIGDIPLRDPFQPSVVITQPMGFPMPYNMPAGYMPPTLGNNVKNSFDTTEGKTWNPEGKGLPQVHAP